MEELRQRNIKFETERIVPVHYKGLVLDVDLRCDLFVRYKVLSGASPKNGLASSYR